MLFFAAVRPVHAHWADLSLARCVVEPKVTTLTVTLPTSIIGVADERHDGVLTAAAMQRHQTELIHVLRDLCVVGDAEGHPYSLRAVALSDTPLVPAGQLSPPSTHSTIVLTYVPEVSGHGLSIDYQLFVPDVPTATCLATIHWQGQVVNHVFSPLDPSFSVGAPSRWPQAIHFMGLGIEHILTGYDHILFLLCLLMMSNGILDLLKTITAFTVAHSVTLSLAVLRVVTVPERLVDSLIAASIAYVAAENLLRKGHPAGRWIVTFGFGLVHGLGFATALTTGDMPTGAIALCLGTFNVGVEIGQIITVLVAYGLLRIIQDKTWQPQFCRFVSAGILCVSVALMLQRMFL